MAADIMGWVRYQYQRIRQYPHYRSEVRQIERRKNGAEFPAFARLKEMRGSYAGMRCFILSDGAGLSAQEREGLQTQITFGVGAFLEQNCFIPTFIGTQNPAEFKRLKSGILSDADSTVLIGDNLADELDHVEHAVLYPYLGVYKYYMNRYREYHVKFSDDSYAVVYDGYHTVYSMIQIAAYFGFSEICLIGCGPTGKERLASAYRTAKEYADEHGIQIVDCTDGAPEAVFPHRDLCDLL